MNDHKINKGLRLPNIREAPAGKISGQGTGSIKLARILLLDDESEVMDSCARVLGRRYLVVKTSSPFEAVSFMDAGRHMIDLVICDYFMPGMNGTEFIDKIRSEGVTTPVILYTGRVADWEEKEFGKFVKILEKPFGEEKLLSTVASVLSVKELGVDAYKRFLVILPHLDISLENLEIYLKGSGLERPSDISPTKALERLGPGEAYNIFLSWRDLHNLRSKIAA